MGYKKHTLSKCRTFEILNCRIQNKKLISMFKKGVFDSQRGLIQAMSLCMV